MEDFAATFMPRFVVSARGRITRAQRALASTLSNDRAAVSQELHALAGEAAVLELIEFADLARAAEAIARRWSAAGEPRDAERCHEALTRLDAEVSKFGEAKS